MHGTPRDLLALQDIDRDAWHPRCRYARIETSTMPAFGRPEPQGAPAP